MEIASFAPEMQFAGAKDIMACVGVGRTKAYEIIQMLNEELEREGYLTFPGKVPVRKLQERLYMGNPVAPTPAGKANGRPGRNRQ